MAKSTSKKIDLLVDDRGSAKQVREQFELLSNTLVETSKKFASQTSSLGYQNSTQTRYIKDEIAELKTLAERRREAYEEKREKFADLRNSEQEYIEKHTAGKLTDDQYAERMKWIEKDRKDLLAGTGYRKEHTFLKGEATAVNADEATIVRLEDLLRDSNKYLREILALDKKEAQDRIQEMQNSENASEKLAADQASVILTQAENREKRGEGKRDDSKSVLGELLKFSNFNSLLNSVHGTLTSNSAVDAARTAGQAAIEAGIGAVDVTAGLVGGLVGKKGGALVEKGLQVIGRVLGTGAKIGNDELLASYTANQEHESVMFRNQAMSGRPMLPYSNSELGYSFMSTSNAINQIARAQGDSKGVEKTTQNTQMLERGWNIGLDVTSALLELTRSNKETDQNLLNIVGGVFNAGKDIFQGDRTFLAEFLSKNFTSVQKELLNKQTSVSSGLVMDVLTQFNNVGGQFDAKHQNSTNLLSSINGSLSTPGGDTMDALTFSALKRVMPEASLGELLREREKGLGSSKYFKAFMDQMDMLGGSDDFKMIQLSNAFGINYEAANSLIKNKDKFTNFSDEELKSQLENGSLLYDAQRNTTDIERNNAKLEDARILGAFDKITELVEQMKSVWTDAWDGASYVVDPASGRLTVKSNAVINTTKKPAQ